MNNETQNQKPWEDTNGNMLSDKNLKTVSKSWDAETWENFLQQTVSIERAEDELLAEKYEALLEETFECAPRPSCAVPEPVVKQIKAAVRILAPQQQKIIKLHFWGGMSEREVACELGILRSNVNDSKKISLNKIKNFLEKDQATCSYLIGGFENSSPRVRSRDEELVEVYNMDLQGSYLK
jgi:predicted DNA-binding protein (UPF0251 family)